MNNQSLILIRNRAILITFPILFVFAFLIVLQSSVECFPFPEWQPFTEQHEGDFIEDCAVAARPFLFSQKLNPNSLSQGVEFLSSVSADSQPITHEKTNQATNETHSNCYEYIINHFEILYLIRLVSFQSVFLLVSIFRNLTLRVRGGAVFAPSLAPEC